MKNSCIALSAIALIGVLTSPAFAQARGRNSIGKESSDFLINSREVPQKRRLHYDERDDETLLSPSRWGGDWPEGVKKIDGPSAAGSPDETLVSPSRWGGDWPK
ncbi:hypothetical protein BGZ83_011953, partial [Gryganskiella cystojenkinii]